MVNGLNHGYSRWCNQMNNQQDQSVFTIIKFLSSFSSTLCRNGVESGAVFTIGKSYLSENHQSYFFIRNDPIRKLIAGTSQSAVICGKWENIFLFCALSPWLSPSRLRERMHFELVENHQIIDGAPFSIAVLLFCCAELVPGNLNRITFAFPIEPSLLCDDQNSAACSSTQSLHSYRWRNVSSRHSPVSSSLETTRA